MCEISSPARALSFETAPPQDWLAEATDKLPPVTRIVLGSLQDSKDFDPQGRLILPQDLATRFDQLTHLHLWHVKALKELPVLPPSLKTLDLRGCEGLTKLPDLPEGLKELDLEGCSGLTELPSAPCGLRELYLGKCESLAKVIPFFHSVPQLEVFDGSGFAGVTNDSVEYLPKDTLRRLVLRSCPNLSEFSVLAQFERLEHVNLQECEGLKSLPQLPVSLRYFTIHGSGIASYLGQGISKADRGAKENENVLAIFRMREKYGDTLALMPHAKVLLMGDGRVGKTTLSKRLLWESLSAEERAAQPDCEPQDGEKPTHSIHFHHWRTGLPIPQESAEAMAMRLGVESVIDSDGLVPGQIGIWDFGGQDIYHHTHRVFASEGSVFVLVWPRECRPLEAPPEGVLSEEWEEWNHPHALSYWLDYIWSMNPEATVAVVCTGCPQGKPDGVNWEDQVSERHRGRVMGDRVKAFYIDSLHGPFDSDSSFGALATWIREQAAARAMNWGMVQPQFFADCATLARQLVEGDRTLLAYDDWVHAMEEKHGELGTKVSLTEEDAHLITRYLHQSGHLFYVQEGEAKAVLLDQEWGAARVYDLLKPGSQLFKTVKRNVGWFLQGDLEVEPAWQVLKPLQRDRLLGFMETSDLVVRLSGRDKSVAGAECFVVTNKRLLSKFEGALRDNLLRRFTLLQEFQTAKVQEYFAFEEHRVSEYEYVQLFAYLAQVFSRRAEYFREGLQAEDDDNEPSNWGFRLQWRPDGADAYFGKLDGVLVGREADREAARQELEDLFYHERSPLAPYRPRIHVRGAGPKDFSMAFFSTMPPDLYDVAISSRGRDKEAVQEMKTALEADRRTVNWYLDTRCRKKEEAQGVMAFMETLAQTRRIILVFSPDYLQEEPSVNWPCAMELADAIVQLGDGIPMTTGANRKRRREDTLVVFHERDGFRYDRNEVMERVRSLLQHMESYFKRLKGDLSYQETKAFPQYEMLFQLFGKAQEESNWTPFTEANGPMDRAMSVDAHPDIVAAVGKAIGDRS